MAITGLGGGFGSLTDIGRQGRGAMPTNPLRPAGGDTPAGPSGPASAPKPVTAPPTMSFGQTNAPGAYGAPGASGSSPLGEWQAWLNSMGPFLAQQPSSMPNQESGGLSSLAPANPGTTGLGLAGYYGSAGPSYGNRGFQALQY